MTRRRSWRSPLTTPNALHKAAHLSVRPIQVSQWKRQLLDGASELYTRGKQTKEAELCQQIGKLQLELKWLKKITAALMPVNSASWSIIPGLDVND